MNNVSKINKDNNVILIAKGFFISIIISVICIFIYSIILINTSVQENTIKPVIMTITGISILIGSSISSLKIKKNGILNGVSVGVMYVISLYILSSIAFCGFGVNGSCIAIFVLGIILGGIGGIIGVNVKH